MRQPQTEQIVWHPYPEEKPLQYGKFILHVKMYVTTQGILDTQEDFILAEFYPADPFYSDSHAHWSDNVRFYKIIAWAEFPKGYKEAE